MVTMGGLVIETIRDGVQFVPDAAAAFRRAEAQVQSEFGRGINCNSTYRSWTKQLSMYDAWNAWVGGWGPHPGHSKAVHPSESFHVSGLALDSDDWRNARIVAILAEHGFIRNRLHVPGEQHHFEYQWWNDRHRGEPVPGGSDIIKLLEDAMSNPIINVVPKYGTHPSNGTIQIGLDDGTFQPLRPPFATNIRGIISVGFLGGTDGSKDTIPTLSQADFNALKPVWATMCKGRTDTAAVWAEGVHAQNADGHALYIDTDGTITTTKTDRPLRFTAAGYLASTNALANEQNGKV